MNFIGIILHFVLIINKEFFLHVFSCPLSSSMLFSLYQVLSTFKAGAKNNLELIFPQDSTKILVLDLAGDFVVSRSFSTQFCHFTRCYYLSRNTNNFLKY